MARNNGNYLLIFGQRSVLGFTLGSAYDRQERVSKQVSKQVSERTNQRTNEPTKEPTSEQTNEREDERTKGRTNERAWGYNKEYFIPWVVFRFGRVPVTSHLWSIVVVSHSSSSSSSSWKPNKIAILILLSHSHTMLFWLVLRKWLNNKTIMRIFYDLPLMHAVLKSGFYHSFILNEVTKGGKVNDENVTSVRLWSLWSPIRSVEDKTENKPARQTLYRDTIWEITTDNPWHRQTSWTHCGVQEAISKSIYSGGKFSCFPLTRGRWRTFKR